MAKGKLNTKALAAALISPLLTLLTVVFQGLRYGPVFVALLALLVGAYATWQLVPRTAWRIMIISGYSCLLVWVSFMLWGVQRTESDALRNQERDQNPDISFHDNTVTNSGGAVGIFGKHGRIDIGKNRIDHVKNGVVIDSDPSHDPRVPDKASTSSKH